MGKKHNNRFIVVLLFCCSFNASAIEATAATAFATLQVNFPGLTSVHTEVLVADGLQNAATGASVKISNWQSDSTSIDVPSGHYDLIIKKGSGVLIIDNVDCTTATCTVDNVAATLTVNFLGLKNVHTAVRVPDAVNGEANGGEITHKNWQNDVVEISVLRQIVDLQIRKGGGNFIVDNLDCRSGSCTVNDITRR